MTDAKTPTILPGPPGYVTISLADLSELLRSAKPTSLPEVVAVRFFINAREVFNSRVQLVRYQCADIPLYSANDVYPRLQMTLGG